jgi:hypothetical protein
MSAAAREVEAVARARGIDLGADAAQLVEDVARATAANHSSMLQDILRGAPTEVDAINGEVVRLGRELGVPTPVNERLWRAVAGLERMNRRGTETQSDGNFGLAGEAPDSAQANHPDPVLSASSAPLRLSSSAGPWKF